MIGKRDLEKASTENRRSQLTTPLSVALMAHHRALRFEDFGQNSTLKKEDPRLSELLVQVTANKLSTDELGLLVIGKLDEPLPSVAKVLTRQFLRLSTVVQRQCKQPHWCSVEMLTLPFQLPLQSNSQVLLAALL